MVCLVSARGCIQREDESDGEREGEGEGESRGRSHPAGSSSATMALASTSRRRWAWGCPAATPVRHRSIQQPMSMMTARHRPTVSATSCATLDSTLVEDPLLTTGSKLAESVVMLDIGRDGESNSIAGGARSVDEVGGGGVDGDEVARGKAGGSGIVGDARQM